MSFTIPPESPKAIKAAAFGRELVKACRARNVPLKEAGRAAGVGHTALDHYRTGAILPKTATARALAEALDWPKLGEIIAAARTFVCERPGCGRVYRHEGGGPRRYCTSACVRMAEAQRAGSRRLRQAGQSTDGRKRAAAIAQLRSAARIADERALMAETAIGSYCRECEPEGLCRVAECPLRAFSPLPLATRDVGNPRTHTEIRDELNRKAAPKRSAAMTRHWSDPDWRARQVAATAAGVARMSPEQVADKGRRISAAKKGRSEAAPWSDERRANHRAGIQAAVARRRGQLAASTTGGGS
jgi:hypothetical protein